MWAPNLSHADGLFHLVHSNVSTHAGGFTDSPNHLVTAKSIDGPWSDPVLLHARGFDASLFHDGADSRLLNLVHDWRRPWYHLLTADGGTGYDHQVTVARSRTLTGPYERDPAGPLITARHHPDLPLQKAGHGSLVDTPGGLSYLAYLVARPHTRHGPCGLGRETALAPVTWTPDGWPRTPSGLPALEIPAPDPLTDGTDPRPDDHDGHDGNTRNWYFLHVTADGEGRAVLRVAACDRSELTVDEAGGKLLGDTTRLRLGLDLDGSALRFRYDTGPGWRPLGPTLDATVLSDEHAEELEGDRIRVLGFTGAFVGLWAWDLTGGGPPADFDEATYRM